MENGYTREEIEQMKHSRVNDLDSDFIGNAIVEKHKDDHIFCSKFFQEDIEYFRDTFRKLKDITERNHLWYSLKNSIEEKIRVDSERSPIEPYLYALKLEDGCFGTELSGQDPDTGKLEAYVKAAHCIYEQSDKEIFFNVVKHTLVNWEWYQPMHVVISLCGEFPQFQDSEVDNILRTYLLYRKKYYRTAYEALLNRPSTSNYEELLKFITKWKNKDIVTDSDIIADYSMLTMFVNAIKVRQDEEIFNHIKSIYTAKFWERSLNRGVREKLEKVFQIRTEKESWTSLFRSFEKADEEERLLILQKIRMDFRMNKRQDRDSLIAVQSSEILDIMIEKINYATDDDRFWGILTLGKSGYFKAKEYLQKTYKTMHENGAEYFPYMLASFLASGKPDMKTICCYYFLYEHMSNVSLYAPMIKHVIYYKKVWQEFQSCLETLIIQFKIVEIESVRLLSRARYIFGSGSEAGSLRIYPIKAMDDFLKIMLEKAFLENNMGILDDIIAILSKITIDRTKSRYEELLLEIIKKNDEQSSQFKKAREILRGVYGR